MERAKYSQHEVDLLDLTANRFATLRVSELLSKGKFPNIQLLVSIVKDGDLYDPYGIVQQNPDTEFILTCNNLISNTDFIKIMGEMLECLDRGYGHPVDTEFTASVSLEGNVKINLLQCRPLWLPGVSGPIELPVNMLKEHILFKAARVISGGVISKIRYIIYIDPQGYSQISSKELKRSVGRIVGRLNAHPHLKEENFL